MEIDLKKNQTSNEYKRKNSAKIPPHFIGTFSPINNKGNDSGSINTNSTTGEAPVFRLKSNSLFLYQESDQFSFLCDGFINQNNNIISNEKEENSENSESNDSLSENSIKDSINDGIIVDKNESRNKKRGSAFAILPSQFVNDLGFNQENDNKTLFQKNLNNVQNKRENGFRYSFNYENNNNHGLNNINNQNRRNSTGFTQFYQNPYIMQNFTNINNLYNKMYFINNINNINNGNANININNNANNININNNINNINNISNINNNVNNVNNNSNNNNENKINYPIILDEESDAFHKKRRSMIVQNNNNLMMNPLNNNYMQLFPNNINNHNQDINILSLSSKNISERINIPTRQNTTNNILLIFQDQTNCRNLQESLELNKNDCKYTNNFYKQIKSEIVKIIEHQFGNYVMQKFFEVLIFQENKKLFAEIFCQIHEKDKIFEICIHSYGTRVFQKTFDKLINNNYKKIESIELNNVIKNLIERHLYNLCCDKNGNHVYQKLLRIFPKDSNNDFLFDNLCNKILDIALLQQGAAIFQTALDMANYKQKEKIYFHVNSILDRLINDKYGNYTMQSIINKLDNELELIEPIYKYILNNFQELSLQKFSSNVIDTFIMKNNFYSKKLIRDIINKNIIKDIIKDQYGNYVIQKMMIISDKEIVFLIIKQIKPIMEDLKQNSIGKKIYEKLMQQYSDIFLRKD